MNRQLRTAVLITSLVTGLAAYADPVLIVSDGVTSTGPITLTGGSGTFVASSFDSSWSVVVVAGESKPLIGSASSPNMELDIQAVSLGSANDLTVTLSDNNFGPTSGSNNVTAHIDGQAFGGSGSVITFNTYVDTNNTLAALTTALTASGGIAPNIYSSTVSNSLSLAGPYSLTEVITIPGATAATYSLDANLNASNQPCACVVSFTCPPNVMICANQPVPDPVTEAGRIVATDTCLGTVPVSFIGAVTNGTCPSPSSITYTFGATSGCGQLFTCNQTITINCLPACDVTTVSNTIAGTSNLTASVQSAGTGASYAWTIMNGTITAGQGTSSITYSAGTDTSNPVIVCVTVTSAAGCQSTCCASVPVTPQSCPCVSHSIQYNFNGTQIIFQSTPGGSYVWFLSDGKVSGLPSNKKVTLHISSQTITIPKTGSMPADITFPVPDAFITFDPAATVATTTFDTVNNVWRETFPTASMAGNILFDAVAFKVPAAGLPGGIKNVNWTGTFTTDTAGISLNWQWHAAAYSNFTSDYNSLAPKPTDDNKASIYKNSDLAGTPEGTDPVSMKAWKSFVEGGASGGGGANYTGSGSSTISVTPCVCPNP
jgi:hypothetical protein